MKKIIALLGFAAIFTPLVAKNYAPQPIDVKKTEVSQSAKKEEAFQDPKYLQDLLTKTRKTATTASVKNLTGIQTLLAESSRGMMYSLQTNRIDLLTRFVIYTINSTALSVAYLAQYVDQNAKRFKFANQTKTQFLNTMNEFNVRLTTLQQQLNDLVYNKADQSSIRSAIDKLEKTAPTYALIIAYNQIMHESGAYTAIDNVIQKSTAPHDIKYLSELIAGLLQDIIQRIPVYVEKNR